MSSIFDLLPSSPPRGVYDRLFRMVLASALSQAFTYFLTFLLFCVLFFGQSCYFLSRFVSHKQHLRAVTLSVGPLPDRITD